MGHKLGTKKLEKKEKTRHCGANDETEIIEVTFRDWNFSLVTTALRYITTFKNEISEKILVVSYYYKLSGYARIFSKKIKFPP